MSCVFCGNDGDFLRFCENCCLPCGDRLQGIDKATLITRMASLAKRILTQLPTGMEECTIQFKECPKGHGWLTAANWAQHGCQTCERERLERIIDKNLGILYREATA